MAVRIRGAVTVRVRTFRVNLVISSLRICGLRDYAAIWFVYHYIYTLVFCNARKFLPMQNKIPFLSGSVTTET